MINKHILLAVSGGIAAYKAAELVRLLRKQAFDVRVVMTESAQAFISPLTFQALSGHPVGTRLLDEDQEHVMGHISLARWADSVLVAPATANCIAKFSHGLSDDLVSTLVLAATCPVFIAPAMNQAMWKKAVTQENVARLNRDGFRFIGPASGEQACGEIGYGRMAEPDVICETLSRFFCHGDLSGKKVLISAGPTREPIDPVRFITNRSSGKMGYAITEAAIEAGGIVTLVSGPVALPPPKYCQIINVESAAQMHEAVMASAPNSDVYIGAAAVADYSPNTHQPEKIKKIENTLILELFKTRDILAEVAALPVQRPFTVGFAAETHDLERYAKDKLAKKNVDMIAANWVGKDQGGFDRDQNALQVYWKGGGKQLEMTDKTQLARQLINLIAEKMNEKNTN
ncbi:MAG: bifunctional phosphopantothenoylcysteine decarboxylase/phosphopantothenate--cysteine ligase CoaBC [Methylicorpusculum sp.]|uniref:bifunctional phosphopantothenoylcysteine decarboxylase/phosphopantothenate--cysteine ligase CoaBC n=1 Tax=Methylicorpusculum sp. TaxID=2713644 RepID=UPI00271EEB26|nr:bifunctional phosphopantothenoylcysteine decarboxylase/phosphopantothenate--cysteine ligase CoaBC [Methylicorpusculum sp.]MDO8940693.1 bifunctional phosphopantothenoylcysteine decarboxylase/phosphopantothenate--cysteine ligase CoaBC [Methylicorpusculum sp.]MDP2202678.1 bifunctional phosphopantothenoylcysteine decarboxylase/phosphopantothenate--cysteine ligase CoaBC [Methylicorpusculum sp.]